MSSIEHRRTFATPTAGPCRICGHDVVVPLHQGHAFSFGLSSEPDEPAALCYVGCTNCGYIQVAQPPSSDFLASYYRNAPVASLDRSVQKTVKKSQHEATLAFLDRALRKKPKCIFETGAGSGHLLRLLAERFEAEVAGIEPSEECRQWAARELGLSLLPSQIREIDLDAHNFREYFDLHVCCSVIEHVVGPVEFLRRVAETVRQGGYIYLEVPSLGVLHPDSDSFERIIQPAHLGYYSPPTLFRLGVEAGLTCVHVDEEVGLEVPIYRALYTKQSAFDLAKGLFRRRVDGLAAQWDEALRICRDAVAAFDNVWIWGIGDDFFDLWSRGSAVFSSEKCHLVDASRSKIGRRIGSLTIAPPDRSACGDPQVILVAPNSGLIQASIASAAARQFPDTPVRFLFKREVKQ